MSILLHHTARKVKGRFVAHGDSITEAPSEDVSERWPTIAAGLIYGGRCDYVNRGRSGYTIAQLNSAFAADFAGLYDARRHFNVAILAGGTNDLVDAGGTYDETDLISRATTWIAAAEGLGFTPFVATLIARDMGGGPPSQGEFDGEVDAYNTWVKANTRAIDFAAMAESKDPNDTTYFKVDKTHPTPALLALMGAKAAAAINDWLAAGMP